MPEGKYPEYDHACMNESKVPSNPQAPMPSISKSPSIDRPTVKRNLGGPSGRKNK